MAKSEYSKQALQFAHKTFVQGQLWSAEMFLITGRLKDV